MKKSVLFILVLMCQGINAQSNAERLDLWQYQKNKRLFVAEQMTFLVGQTQEYGKLQLEYQKTSGDFKKSQQAEEQRLYQFDVEGFTDIDRFKAYGRFTFGLRHEDGLANDLRSGRKDELQPFYYYANFPNNIQNQQYFANTMFSYEILRNKLYGGFGIDFDYNWTTGNRDPRPDITNYFIRYKWDLSYRLNKHLIGVGYAMGRTSEDMNEMMFKNSEIMAGNKYPDRFVNVSLGYGDIVLSSNNRKLERDGHENQFNIAYQYSAEHLEVLLYADKKDYRENAELNKATEAFSVYNKYTIDQVSFKSLVTYKVADRNYQFGLEYFNYEGQNKRTVEGINYEANHSLLTGLLQASYQSLWKNVDMEFGLTEQIESTERKDFAVGNKVKYQGLINSVHINAIYNQNNDFYRLSLMPMYRMKLTNSRDLEPTQETNFTREVILPDFNYYNKNAFGIKGEIGYGTKELIKKYCLYFSLGYQHFAADSQNRNTLTASVNMFL